MPYKANVIEHTKSNPMSETTPTQTVVPPTEEPTQAVSGTIVNANTSKELSGGATAGISTAIGVGNVCCGPLCYTCPTVLSSIVGIVLYFSWKDEKPKTAKTILIVTLVTGLIALGGFGVLVMFGFASTLLQNASY